MNRKATAWLVAFIMALFGTGAIAEDINTNNTNTNNTTINSTNTNNNNNVNTSTSTNTNTNINTNTSTSTNTNVNTNTSTSVNTNNNNNVNTSTSTNTNINQNDSTVRTIQSGETTTNIKSPPPTAVAPSMMSGGNSDLCTTGVSAGVQTQILGIAAGGTVTDLNCERIKLAKNLFDMGMKVAAVSTLCQDGRVFQAMEMAGTPCPFMGDIGPAAAAGWAAMPGLRPDYEEYLRKQEYISDVKRAIDEGKNPADVKKKEPINVDKSFFFGLGAGALLLLLL